MPKGYRKCKNCGVEFKKIRPLQSTCSVLCAVEWAKNLKAKKEKQSIAKNKKDLETQTKTDTRNKRVLDLQIEVNKLARNIDHKFNLGCIDCEKEVFGVGNGAHYHNVGGNENIRFNLHNIHLSRIFCNKYSSEHKKGYKENLRARYGLQYYELVEFELRKQYPVINLSFDQVKYALKTVRSINRNFETYELNDPISSRDYFNSVIGIYIK